MAEWPDWLKAAVALAALGSVLWRMSAGVTGIKDEQKHTTAEVTKLSEGVTEFARENREDHRLIRKEVASTNERVASLESRRNGGRPGGP